MGRVFTGLLSYFDVYKSAASKQRLGEGYRIMYEHKNEIHTSMTLIDTNGIELPDGMYHLVIGHDEDRLVVIPEDIQ